jgi:hypothetical protein
MKAIDSPRRSAEWVFGVLWRGFFFFHFVRRRSDDVGDLIQPRRADGARLVMVHEQFVGSREIGFGSRHPSAEEISGYQLVLSFDGVSQSSCQGV